MNHSFSCSRAKLTAAALACVVAWSASAAQFEPPVRMTAEGKMIQVDSPGWAAPAWADIDGDGDKDLLVGQFDGGKIHVFRNKGDGTLAAGEFLKTGKDVARVPGVW